MSACIRRAAVIGSKFTHLPLTPNRLALPVRTLSTLQNTSSFLSCQPSLSRAAFYKDGFSASAGISLRRWSTETNSKHTEENQPPPEGGASAGAGAAKDSSDEIKGLDEKNKKLLTQLEETQDKYRRALAEMENVRQRLNKQIEDAKLFGIQGFCKDLLEVADVLNKATDSVPQSELAANSHLKTLHSGLLLTETQLNKVFTRHGLVQISPAEGEKFDPHFHEALFQQPAIEGKSPGTISTVTKIGYKLHNRTLRPAIVGVFVQS